MTRSSPVLVAADEDRSTHIVSALAGYNVPAVAVNDLPVDYMWTVDGLPVMGDRKTPADLIASAQDGRLFDQILSMQERGANPYFILVELTSGMDSLDGGYTVGYNAHAWGFDDYEDLIFSVQVVGGAKVTRSPTAALTPRRLAALWRWLDKTEKGSWRAPVIPRPSEPIYFDREYRSKVAMLMTLPLCGEKKANLIKEELTLAEFFSMDLETATARWKTFKGVGPKIINEWIRFLTT